MQRVPQIQVYSKATVLGCLSLSLMMAGCASEIPDHAARMSRGYVYYCDGAGGGRHLTFGEGLRKGLIDGGWPGSGEIFPWNTGLGVLADQKASVDYKRRKARELAHRASAYTHDHPDTPVVLIGLSAGTAVTIFSLEELPPDSLVEDVVLCGA